MILLYLEISPEALFFRIITVHVTKFDFYNLQVAVFEIVFIKPTKQSFYLYVAKFYSKNRIDFRTQLLLDSILTRTLRISFRSYALAVNNVFRRHSIKSLLL